MFNQEPKLMCYFSDKQFGKSPIHHVGYLGSDMLYVVSSVCAMRMCYNIVLLFKKELILFYFYF